MNERLRFLWLSAVVAGGLATPISVASQEGRSNQSWDLTGTWATADGSVVSVVQRGARIEGRIVVPNPVLVARSGWRSGDLAFEGTIVGDDITGKGAIRFPLELSAKCPEHALVMADLRLQILGPGQLLGRARNRILRDDCSVSEGPVSSLEYLRQGFDVTETATHIEVEIRDGILFDFDRSDLKPSALAVLENLKTLVLDVQPFKRVRVGGHTDDRGTDAYNVDLSTRRANAVASWLAGHGVTADRLEAKGFGKGHPLVPNSNADNRTRNRRVEITVLK
jgi:outer membrane protein OmpA-like peptidoglycan-associated protein